MKIIHLINYFQPQLGYQEYFIAKEQVKSGHDVYLITSNFYFPFPNYDNAFLDILGPREFNPVNKKIDGIKVICLPIYFEQPGKRVLLKGLKNKLFKIRPDLVIAHGEYTFYALQAAIWKKRLDFDLVVDSHAHPHDNNPGNNKRPNFFKRLISSLSFFLFRKLLWSRNDVFWVSTSSWNYNFFSDRCKIPLEKIKLIANGSEIDRFFPDSKIKKIWREKYNIRKDEIVILYTGKISERKNVHKILLCTEHLRDDYKIRYLFVGNMANDFKLKYNDLLARNSESLIHVSSVNNAD